MHHSRRALLGPALSSAAVALFGGADTTSAAAARESLRRAQTSAPRPGARRDHSLTADPERGVLYLFGELASNAWHVSDVQHARVSHDIAIVGDHAHGFGGTDGSNELCDIWGQALIQ
jgi:hypothetical protein